VQYSKSPGREGEVGLHQERACNELNAFDVSFGESIVFMLVGNVVGDFDAACFAKLLEKVRSEFPGPVKVLCCSHKSSSIAVGFIYMFTCR